MKQVVVIAIIGLAVGFTAGAKDWYETAAFYQIYPQTFFDGGDVSAFPGLGTLKGIEAKLDYIKDLGIDCVWLNPIFQSSFKAFGYDITDYKEIDSRYGTLADFERLVAEVHKKGMKIIVDFVPNHCGEHHPFFQDFKSQDGHLDWFVSTDTLNYNLDKSEKFHRPSNWQQMGDKPGSAWNEYVAKTETEAAKFYYAQYSGNMPDFNLRNDDVKAYLQEVMEYWLEVGVDGFRIDAISHGFEAEINATTSKYPNEAVNPAVTDETRFDHLIHTFTQDQPELFDLIYDWREFINGKKSETGYPRILMTESYSSVDVIKKFYKSADGQRDGAHLPFNFQLITTLTNSSTAADIVKMIDDWLKALPEGKAANWVIGNHDNSRVASRFGEKRVDILNTMVTMLPGSFVTYYGEEIGMADSCAKFPDDIHVNPAVTCDEADRLTHTDTWVRSPMQWNSSPNGGFTTETPWIPIGENYQQVNVEAQTNNAKSHLEIYRSLLKLRKENAIKESDDFEIKKLNDNSFAFKRTLADKKQQSIVVVINFGDKAEKVHIKNSLHDMPDLMTVEITGGESAFKKGDQISISSEFELKAFESIVAFYNSSLTPHVSMVAFILLIAICAFANFKFS